MNRAERRYKMKLVKKQDPKAWEFMGFNVNYKAMHDADLRDHEHFNSNPTEVLYIRPFIDGEYVQMEGDPNVGDWDNAHFVLVASRLDFNTGIRALYRKPFNTEAEAQQYKENMLLRLAA